MSDAPKSPEDPKEARAPEVEPRRVHSEGEIEVEGERFVYRATAGTQVLRDEDGQPRASVFFVSYRREDLDADRRPITFVFNGGPGSSATWLHLGALGPRRVDIEDARHPPPPPYTLEDNPDSLLDVTDLVFVDPVGTGFSRPEGEAKLEDFLDVKADVASMADFIRDYLTEHGRWNSPKYLIGESYGSTRCAGLAAELLEQNLLLNGVGLISCALAFQTFVFETGNDLPHVLYLPSYAATAHFHGAVPRTEDLEAWLEEVEQFAVREYAPALLFGGRLSTDERDRIARRLETYTGVAAAYWARSQLRVPLPRFMKELLREQGLVVGRMDSRYLGTESDPLAADNERDPGWDAPRGPYAALVNHYLRGELGYEASQPYALLNMKVNESWRWPIQDRMGYLDVATALRKTMLACPHLEVFFAHGRYDLATPYFAGRYTASHLGPEPALRRRIHESTYEAGHMMYLNPGERTKLKQDLLLFYRRTNTAGI